MKAVRIWLWTGAVMVIIQVMIGGITRLTESGLSITEWDVVMGSLPPTSEARWIIELDHYKTSAQYQKINTDFTINQFKKIYWWEFIHRLWARIIS
ncbi:MAG: COX15/CtaA family protein, partial [Chitinophagales bacterium]